MPRLSALGPRRARHHTTLGNPDPPFTITERQVRNGPGFVFMDTGVLVEWPCAAPVSDCMLIARTGFSISVLDRSCAQLLTTLPTLGAGRLGTKTRAPLWS